MPYFSKSNPKFKALKFWCADESWSYLVPLHINEVLSQVNGLMFKFKTTPKVVFHPTWTRFRKYFQQSHCDLNILAGGPFKWGVIDRARTAHPGEEKVQGDHNVY